MLGGEVGDKMHSAKPKAKNEGDNTVVNKEKCRNPEQDM